MKKMSKNRSKSARSTANERSLSRPRASKRPSIQHRRARALLILCALFAIVVLATSLPVSMLMSQHVQLSSTSKQLSLLESENKVLEQEAKQLSEPSTLGDMARRDYGLVTPGSQAYEILPAPGSSVATATSSGHVPLDGPPVVPGSAESQELLAAGALQVSGPATSSGTGDNSSPSPSSSSSSSDSKDGRQSSGSEGGSAAGSSSGGFWTRVEHSLEFWR